MITYNIDYDRGVINHGNWYRIHEAMKKAQQKKEISVGFLGGSITQGSLSSTPETCYAYLVYQWWEKRFEDTNIRYINAGVGGTGSDFGVARVENDILQYEPDVVFIEFSVNDLENDFFEETFDGLIRKTYNSKSKPAVIIINSVQYDTGINAEKIHLNIAKTYGIPCVSMKPTIYDALQKGIFTNKEVTPDNLHPNDLGHKLMAENICNLLDKMYENMGTCEDNELELPVPVTPNAYEGMQRYQNICDSVVVHNTGFEKDMTPQHDVRDSFKKGWMAKDNDASIKFDLEGSNIMVQYRKSVIQLTPIAKAILDGDEEHAIILDGNFDQTWGDCLYLQNIADHIKYGKHQLEIRLVTTHDDDKVPFYLISVIAG